MNFKEQLRLDIRIFLNLAEFADIHGLIFTLEDGSTLELTLPIVVEENELTFGHDFEPELGLIRKTFYIATENLPKSATLGSTLIFENSTWSIEKRSDAGGMTRLDIALRQYG